MIQELLKTWEIHSRINLYPLDSLKEGVLNEVMCCERRKSKFMRRLPQNDTRI